MGLADWSKGMRGALASLAYSFNARALNQNPNMFGPHVREFHALAQQGAQNQRAGTTGRL